MTNYQNLDVWKKSMLLVKEIYTELKYYPKEEMYGLTSQTKKAAVSIPANIAEGVGRNYKKDTVQFLHIARGSLYELETLLQIAEMLGVLKEEKLKQIQEQIQECLRLLNGFITYYEKSTLK
ncbi:MAG: four helix bundle protein [Chitinophagaceae bacterium]